MTGLTGADPLGLDPEAMRRAGYRAVDALVAATTEWSMPPIRRATPAAMRSLLSEPAPEEPVGIDAALERLLADVVPHAARTDHPRYMAFIPTSGTWPGALGDFVASALSIYGGSWMEGAGPTQLELTVLDWFKDWLGLSPQAEGQLTSGGSTANLQALACARETLVGAMRDDLVLYVSDQAHSSIARAARVLGFRPDRVRVLPTDTSIRLQASTLAEAIDADRARGLTPLAACVTAGTTNAGAVDPLPEIAAVTSERGVWLHVDGAYGAFAALTERGRGVLTGLELADSLTLDPHKWLYQSYECGCVMVRHPGALQRAFEVIPPYLREVHSGDPEEVNLGDRGIQLSRTTRVFKVWLSVQSFGVRGLREAIDRALDHAEHAARRIEASATLELMTTPALGIVCFRRRFAGVEDEHELARLNGALLEELESSGTGFLTSTTLRGQLALRMCPMNHATTRADVDAVIDALETMTPSLDTHPARHATGDAGVRRTWLHVPVGEATGGVDARALAQVPLLAGLDDAGLTAATALAERRVVPAGVELVRRWDATRDFYVVLDGEVSIERDGVEVARTRAGGFFGELAALDWGRGYGYSRNATVTTVTSTTLAVFPEGTLARLMALSSEVAFAIEEAAASRLTG